MTLDDFVREMSEFMVQRDWSAAAATASACRKAWPLDRAGWLLGSFIELSADRKEAALQLVDERLAIDPGDLECLVQRAECLFGLGRRTDALAAAELAAASGSKLPGALDAVGEFLVAAREHRAATKVYDQAIALAPDNLAFRIKRAMLHRYLGDFNLAARDYDAVLALSPTHSDALQGRAALLQNLTDRSTIAAMEAALAAGPADSKEASKLHFALAKAYEELGDHAANWRHLIAGNGLERARTKYDSRLDRAVFERIIAAFPRAENRLTDTTGESPIFIVGLPRTGTTLVDRILGSHSQVFSAGELGVLLEAISSAVGSTVPLNTLDWVGFASAFGNLEGNVVAREYLTRVQALRGKRPRFTDKNSINFFHCALIFRAFPNARIVHVTRHPMAACYAIFKTRFAGAFPFANQLEELADFYVGYRKLMAHWHQILPRRILDIAYENVVTALEPTTHRLLDYIGLPFEPDCLQFYVNRDAVTTNSLQVRQPLYKSSLEQWQNYATQLAPLRVRLEAASIPID